MDDESRVRAELERQQEDTRATMNRGIVMLAMVPVVIVAAIGLAIAVGSATAAIVALLGACAYALIGGIGGIAMITSGAVEHRRLTKELRAIDEPYQLPAARLVVR